MTSPPQDIIIQCPTCNGTFKDWWRPSINLQLDHFDDEYLKRATVKTCPHCQTEIRLDTLIVDEDGVWHLGRAKRSRKRKEQETLHQTVATWIIQVLEAHPAVMGKAMLQRAKFEGWLKFELAALAETCGATEVAVETGYNDRSRADLSFSYHGITCLLELKTANTSRHVSGIENKKRPLSKNLKSIVDDVTKLQGCDGVGLVAFVLFPIPRDDVRWQDYLEWIFSETGIALSPQEHCRRVPISLGKAQTCEAVVCCFLVNRVEDT
jgi:hypothetical protein